MKIKFFIPLLCAAFALCACVSDDDDPEYVSLVKVGDKIPEFATEVLSPYGESEAGIIKSSDFEGRRSLLVLFYSKCGDCERELGAIRRDFWPAFEAAQAANPDKYMFAAIARKEGAEAVAAHWSANGYTPMPYYPDPAGKVYYKFATGIVPRIYIVDEEGVIEHMWVEKLTVSPAKLLELLLGAE